MKLPYSSFYGWLILSVLVFSNQPLYPQIGIGTTAPDASAALEVSSSDRGFLPPRIALINSNQATPVSNPVNGLLVYNTASAGSPPNEVFPGYYYWQAGNWNRIAQQPNNTRGSNLANVRTTYPATSVGTYYDTLPQSIVSNNAASVLKFRQSDISRGIAIVNDSRISFQNSGIYKIVLSAKVQNNATNSSGDQITFWLRKNGMDIPFSATDFTVTPGVVNTLTCISKEYFQEISGGDYIEIIWSTPNKEIFINSTTHTLTTSKPTSPAISITVSQIP